ncbi:MAG: hypothetical protein V4524_04170 [Patescibacteria group bacterium]
MKNILISAFSAYGNYPANSSELAIRNLNGKVLSGFSVFTEIFSASIPEDDRGSLLFERALSINARGIISLGMGSEKIGLTVETCVINHINNAKYCPSHQNGRPIDSRQPYGEKIHLDLNRWNLLAFRKNCAKTAPLITTMSADAGGFCCNHLMYQLHRAHTTKPEFRWTPWIYIHIPCSPESITTTVEEFERSGKMTMSTTNVIKGLELLLLSATL